MICRNSHQFAKTLLLVSIAVIVVVASTATPTVASGTFQKTGSMNVARMDHTATLLSNGEVLVAGGVISGASAELYNPSTGTWSFTGSMTTARFNHQAVLLPNGEDIPEGTIATLFLIPVLTPSRHFGVPAECVQTDCHQ